MFNVRAAVTHIRICTKKVGAPDVADRTIGSYELRGCNFVQIIEVNSGAKTEDDDVVLTEEEHRVRTHLEGIVF